MEAYLSNRSATAWTSPAAALDDVLADALEWECQDYQEVVEGILRGAEDVNAGPHTSCRLKPNLTRFQFFEWLLAQHAGDAGLHWFMAMYQAIASLANFPERCTLAPETNHFLF